MSNPGSGMVANPKSHLRCLFLAAMLSFLISLVIVTPYFFLGTASGHDFEFHMASWQDVAFQWSEGTLYPRWTALTNHGFGEPRYIFYPPFSWIAGAALVRTVPGPWVPVLFVVFAQTLAGINAFLLLKRLVAWRAAIFGALSYTANANFLLMVYIRSDFAEQLACAFFPLLLLGAIRVGGLLEDESSHASKITGFAVPFAAIWLCNAPAGVIATYSSALLFTWGAVRERRWANGIWGALSMGLGFGLSGFYLVPAVYEQRWVNIGQALSSGLLPAQNFLFTPINDVEHTWFNWIASLAAVALIILCGVAALGSGCFGRVDQRRAERGRVAAALLVLGVPASLLMLRISLPLWSVLPKLKFIQFPWRWMSIVGLICACFLAFAAQKRGLWVWALVFLAFTLPLAPLYLQNGWWDPDEMDTLQGMEKSGFGFDGTDEYDPIGDDHQDLPARAPLASRLATNEKALAPQQQGIRVLQWMTERKRIEVEVPVESRVALRVLNYPAWRVEVGGKEVVPERADDVNQMVVAVPAGRSVIGVKFVRTWDRTAGIVLSLASLLLLAAIWLKQS